MNRLNPEIVPDFARMVADLNRDVYELTIFRQQIADIELRLPVWWGLKNLHDPDYWGCSQALLICYGKKPALLAREDAHSEDCFRRLCREWTRFTDFESTVVIASGSNKFGQVYAFPCIASPTDDDCIWEIECHKPLLEV